VVEKIPQITTINTITGYITIIIINSNNNCLFKYMTHCVLNANKLGKFKKGFLKEVTLDLCLQTRKEFAAEKWKEHSSILSSI
jgi:hypothetical protein